MPSKRTQEFILEPLSARTFFRAALPYALRIKWTKNKNDVLHNTELDMDTMDTQEVPLLYAILSKNKEKLFPATKKDAEYISAAKKRRNEVYSFGSKEKGVINALVGISLIMLLVLMCAHIGTLIALDHYVNHHIAQSGWIGIILISASVILFLIVAIKSSLRHLDEVTENTILFSELSKVKVSVIVDNEHILGITGSGEYTELSRKIADAIYDDDFSRCAQILNCEPNFEDVIDQFKDATSDARFPYIPFVSNQGVGSLYYRNIIPQHVENKVEWKIYETTIDMLHHLVRTSPALMKDSYGREKLSTLLTVTALKSFHTLLPIIREEQERKNDARKAQKQHDHDEVDAVFQSFFDVL